MRPRPGRGARYKAGRLGASIFDRINVVHDSDNTMYYLAEGSSLNFTGSTNH